MNTTSIGHVIHVENELNRKERYLVVMYLKSLWEICLINFLPFVLKSVLARYFVKQSCELSKPLSTAGQAGGFRF